MMTIPPEMIDYTPIANATCTGRLQQANPRSPDAANLGRMRRPTGQVPEFSGGSRVVLAAVRRSTLIIGPWRGDHLGRGRGTAGSRTVTLVPLLSFLSLAACASATTGVTIRLSATYSVPALREPLTTDAASPVAHDTETDALVEHDGRLYATTDQWEYPGPFPHGQILVKDSAAAPWRVLEETQGLRVQDTLASFTIPAGQGLGPGHSPLITEAVIGGRHELQWLVDRASSFAPADSYVLPSDVIDVRAFGALESGGQWAVYAGVDPTGILRGVWSRCATRWSSTRRQS